MERNNFDRFLIIVIIVMGLFCLYDLSRRLFPNIFNTNNPSVQRTQTVNRNRTPNRIIQPLKNKQITKVNYQADRIKAVKDNTNKYIQEVNSIPIEKSRGPIGSFYGVAKSEQEYLKYQYINYIKYSILANWSNPTRIVDDMVIFKCSIDNNGYITGYDVTKPAKNTEFFRSAESALVSVSPLLPSPNVKSFNVIFSGYSVDVYNINNPYENLTYSVPDTDSPVPTVAVNDAKSVNVHFGISYKNGSPNHNISNDAHKNIIANWLPPLDTDSDVIIQYVIGKDGRAKDISFAKKSYNNDADTAAYAAIKSIRIDNQDNTEYNSTCGFTVKQFYMKQEY